MNLLSLAPEIQEEMSRPRSWAADSSSCDGSTRASLAIVTNEREGPIHAGVVDHRIESGRLCTINDDEFGDSQPMMKVAL